MIHADVNTNAEYVTINTINGSPEDVVFYGSVSGDYTGTRLNCQAGTSLINGYSFQGSGDCWITDGTTTTTTLSPATISPTITPSSLPSVSPSISPTTTNPTYQPSKSPTSSAPSIAPSGIPSISPTTTASPTNLPTKNPDSPNPSTLSPTVSTTMKTSDLPTSSTNDNNMSSTYSQSLSQSPTPSPLSSAPIDPTEPNTTTDIIITQEGQNSDLHTNKSTVNMLVISLYIGICISGCILLLCLIRLIWAVYIKKKEKGRDRFRSGEASLGSIGSQEIAKGANGDPKKGIHVTDDSIYNESEEKEIELITRTNSMIIEPNVNIHIIQSSTSSISANMHLDVQNGECVNRNSMEQLMAEGNVLQIINTPQDPPNNESENINNANHHKQDSSLEFIPEEELMQIKRKYNKQKSTLSGYSEDYNPEPQRRVSLIHELSEDGEDSEELYIDNDKPLRLERYDTPTMGGMDPQISMLSTTDTPQSGINNNNNNVNKLRKHKTTDETFDIGPSKTEPQWM